MTTLTKKVNGLEVALTPEEAAEFNQRKLYHESQELFRAKSQYQQKIQSLLDAKAQEYGYDSIFTAVTYAEEPSVPAFQAEAQALRAWRSAVRAYAYQVLAEVEAGDIGLPSLEDFIAGMPAYVSPA